MTVLRSRVIGSAIQKEHSHQPLKSASQIEPLTPAKEAEPMNKSSHETTPTMDKLVQSSDKPGSVGSRDSGSPYQGLRRSARLSSKSSLDNVGFSKKRKAVDPENGEHSSGINGTGMVVSNGRVSREFDTVNEEVQSVRKGKSRRVLSVDVGVAGSASLQDGDVGKESLKPRSGKKLSKTEVKQVADDKKLSASKDQNETEERESEAVNEVSKGSLTEKGKGKVEVGSSSNHSDMVDSDVKFKEETMMGDTIADTVTMEQAATERASTSTSTKRDQKEMFKDIARKNASRFAYFSAQEEEDDPLADEAELELPPAEANGDVEDWPGPFSTAMKIIRERAVNMPAPQKDMTLDKSQSVPLIWVPKEKQQRNGLMRVAPSLQELCMAIIAENVDAISSLASVPDVLRHKLTHLLCDCRKMNAHFLNLLASRSPSEIRIRDCSWLNEEQFTKTFEGSDTSNLTVLQLDQCGRCLPDYVLLTTLAQLPNKLSALTTISLKGACRLSDAGLNALVASAPALRSINLGCCSLLTSDGIINLADKLGPVLKELYIDECFGIDAKLILPALLKLESLEVLSIGRYETVTDSFIRKLVAVRGEKMKELVLADCTKLTDKSLQAIAESCPGLCAIDLSNVCKLTDNAIGHLANGCQAIQTLKFCRNAFSDEAVAAYLEACGGPLKELSLNHVDKVGHHTALSLAKHAKNLLSLDLSWCRNMTNEALGLIVDSCLSLKMLKLFGCTQITNVFIDGHSNEEVIVKGLKESQILKNIEVPHLLPLRYSSV